MQCFLYGDNKPYNILLVIPNLANIYTYAKKFNLNYNDNDETLLNLDEIKILISKEILEISTSIKSYERKYYFFFILLFIFYIWCCTLGPQKWFYSFDQFTQENYLLTPKMSLRRNNVLKLYNERILKLYEINTEGKDTHAYGIRVRNENHSELNKQD